MEQQRNAFQQLGFVSISYEEFLESMSPFKSKTPPHFPLPENIYKKKFPFLGASLLSLQREKKEISLLPISNKAKDSGKKESPSSKP